MMAMARPWASAMPRRPRPPAPCKYWSVQIEPAPKKVSANVPRNSAISFCEVLYIRKPPCREGRCAQFERLHSIWNATRSASLPDQRPAKLSLGTVKIPIKVFEDLAHGDMTF